jgi:biopolymer transport protein ExbD
MSMGQLPEGQGGDELEGGGIFADINITPLTDIFLVLLIIFMVTASAAKDAGQGGIKVTLPQGGAAEAAKAEPPLDVFVVNDGRIFVDGKEISSAALESMLTEKVKKDPLIVVRVRADEELRHKQVVSVLDLVKRCKVTRLSIATQVKR